LSVKLLLIGDEALLSFVGANALNSNVAATEFNLCPAVTKSQRYLDKLYRCHPGTYLRCNLIWWPEVLEEESYSYSSWL